MKGSKTAAFLAYRRKVYDELQDDDQPPSVGGHRGFKRPGSLNAHKQGSKAKRY